MPSVSWEEDVEAPTVANAIVHSGLQGWSYYDMAALRVLRCAAPVHQWTLVHSPGFELNVPFVASLLAGSRLHVTDCRLVDAANSSTMLSLTVKRLPPKSHGARGGWASVCLLVIAHALRVD